MYERLNAALSRCGSRYPAGPRGKWPVLLTRLATEGISEMEYIALIRKTVGAGRLVEGYLCSDAAWDTFMLARDNRIEESAMYVRMNLDRLAHMDEEDMVDQVEDKETELLAIMRFCILKAIAPAKAKKWGSAAAWELACRPELRNLITDKSPSSACYIREVETYAP